MWIVRVALRRPYTFIVLAIMLVLLGVFTILRTVTDIFPAIRIPVVAVIWSYNGLPPDEMVYCGMAVGYPDRAQPVNDFPRTRITVDELAEFRGF